ncbi:MAG: hypothetical protein AAFV33_18305 [Chloroflexota bacterium]
MNQWIFIGRVLLIGAGVVAVAGGTFIYTADDLPAAQKIVMAIGLLLPLGAQVAFAMMMLRRGNDLHPPED